MIFTRSRMKKSTSTIISSKYTVTWTLTIRACLSRCIAKKTQCYREVSADLCKMSYSDNIISAPIKAIMSHSKKSDFLF